MICTEAFQLIFVVVDCFVLLWKKSENKQKQYKTYYTVFIVCNDFSQRTEPLHESVQEHIPV